MSGSGSTTDTIRQHLERGRDGLADAVDGLSDKVDLQAARDRASDLASNVAASASHAVDVAREAVPGQAQHAAERASEVLAPLPETLKRSRGRVLLGVAALAAATVLIVAVVRRRRAEPE